MYDVTNWVKKHPGGEFPLLNLARQDVTDAFIAYHPATAWHYLNKFSNGYYLKHYSVSEFSKLKLGLFEKKGHGVLWQCCLL